MFSQSINQTPIKRKCQIRDVNSTDYKVADAYFISVPEKGKECNRVMVNITVVQYERIAAIFTHFAWCNLIVGLRKSSIVTPNKYCLNIVSYKYCNADRFERRT